jgi:hypothetical protein
VFKLNFRINFLLLRFEILTMVTEDYCPLGWDAMTFRRNVLSKSALKMEAARSSETLVNITRLRGVTFQKTVIFIL